MPALTAISHGTSSPLGQRAVEGLVEAVARARPDLTVTSGFVDVQQPDVATALASLDDGIDAVVVPLLLSAGYHVHVDLRNEIETAAGGSVLRGAVLADALGPDLRLVNVLIGRLHQLGLRSSDRIVLACAGSSDQGAVADCREMARMMSQSLGMPVRAGFISAADPPLAEAVLREQEQSPCSRVIVSTYLLAPGYFCDLAAATQADLVAAPLLLPHEPPAASLVDLVLERFHNASELLELARRDAVVAEPPLGLA